MRAFHSNWTKPFFEKYKGEYYIEDFELLTTILSALKWQEFNGDIQMITDEVGAAYYRKIGLEKIWNLGINDSLEKNMPDNINPCTFWAAGKLYALKKQMAPCVMLDTDFIIWEPLEEVLLKHDVTVIHREVLQESVYPPKEKLKVHSSYYYPKEWNWTIDACNTAFACFNHEGFKDYYVKQALRFMHSVEEENWLTYMVFAEQRLLAMCAEEKKIDLFSLSTLEDLFESHQKQFTHIWGYKQAMRNDSQIRTRFCKRCVTRIKQDYPEIFPILHDIESLAAYLL